MKTHLYHQTKANLYSPDIPEPAAELNQRLSVVTVGVHAPVTLKEGLQWPH